MPCLLCVNGWSGSPDVIVQVVCGRCRTFCRMRKTSISFPGGRGSARGLVQTRHGTLDVSAYRGAVPLERTIQALQSLVAACSPTRGWTVLAAASNADSRAPQHRLPLRWIRWVISHWNRVLNG